MYALSLQSLNLKYIVFYTTQKRQKMKSGSVNSAPSNLIKFCLFCIAHSTMYFKLRYDIFEVHIIIYMYIFLLEFFNISTGTISLWPFFPIVWVFISCFVFVLVVVIDQEERNK
jgi:hypothetical protein